MLNAMRLKISFRRRDKDFERESIVGLRQVYEEENGIELQYLNGLAKIQAVRPGIIRIRIAKSLNWPEKISDAVVAKPSANYELERTPDQLNFSTGKLRLLIPEGPFRFEIYDRAGNLLSRDFPGLGPGFGQDDFLIHRHILPEEAFYGLGDKFGALARSGKVWKFWNRDAYLCYEKDPRYTSIPFLISLRPDFFCGWYVDHPGILEIDVGKKYPGLVSIRGFGADPDLYFLCGKSLKELVSLFTELVGRSFFPPLWALGYHQSRWSYFSQREVEDLADEFEKRQIPLAAVYLDIHYMDRYKVFTIDRNRFPDLGKMAEKLRTKGIRLVSIINPGVKAEDGYKTYEDGRSKNYFCADEQGVEFQANVWPRNAAFPDFFQPEVRDFWAEQHKPLFDQGVSGIWNDMNEPSMWSTEIRLGDFLVPIRQIHSPRIMHKIGRSRLSHTYCRNLYGQKMCEATADAFRRFRPGLRPFLLSRSGFAGIQRFAALWTGDNKSTFKHLAKSVAEILSLGLSGVGFAGADIGGFRRDCSAELYARWIQLAAFYPFCRTHSALRARRQEPYSFGPEVEAIARKYIQLRYCLLPMIYSLFRENAETGLPLLRPLMMEFVDDHAAKLIEDEIMLGEFLMLAPVLKEKAREREIYLMPGTWVDFWEEKAYAGPGWIKLEAPLERMPILVREGAVIISQPNPELRLPWPELLIDLYPCSKPSRFQLYEDDGESDGYLRGEFAQRELALAKIENGCRLSIAAKLGKFPVPARKARLRFHLQTSEPKIFFDGAERKDLIWRKEKNLAEVEILLDDQAHSVDLTH